VTKTQRQNNPEINRSGSRNGSDAASAPRNVRTVEHEEAVLNVFEEDGTATVSREMGLSKSSVQRVLADNTVQQI
jgi:hypothetical protein